VRARSRARGRIPRRTGEHFGWLCAFLALDAPASSTLTRELMAWQPTHPGLIDDLNEGHYFEGSWQPPDERAGA
jgi:hypothetical protein